MTDINLPLNFLATRLCHDVIGPISAMNQGLELLEDADESMREEAMKLIVQSAQQASVRLQFYRMAYGHTTDAGTGSLAQKLALIEGFLAPLKITFGFASPDAKNISYSHQMLRLIINGVIVAAETMLRGGVMTFSDASDGQRQGCVFHIRAVTLKIEDGFIEALCGENTIDYRDPKSIQHHMTLELLHLLGGALDASRLEDGCWQLALYVPK